MFHWLLQDPPLKSARSAQLMESLPVSHLTSRRHVHVFDVVAQKDAVAGSTGINAPTLAGIAIGAVYWSVQVVLQRSHMFKDALQHKIWTQMILRRPPNQHWVWGQGVQINQCSHSTLIVLAKSVECKLINFVSNVNVFEADYSL
jgi:hypothetical protein